MSHILTANTARSNVNTALVAGIAQPYTPKAFPTLTFGETTGITLYLIDAANSYDARSGTTGYTPRVSIMLPTLQPTSGTFTISDGVRDAYSVSGAGTSEVNGVYIRNGNSSDGNPAYTFYESDGVTARYNMWSINNILWVISEDDIDSAPVADAYSARISSSTPPETGWESALGEDPAPILSLYEETITANYDASASELETALNAMNSGAGPFGDLVTVTKFADGTFSILFDSVGAQTELSVSAGGIQPTSAASVLPLVEGDATTREEQLIRILAEPLVFEDSAVEVANGWTMTLSANNANILRALAAEQGDMSANYSIDIVSPTSTVDVVARGPVILKEGSFDVAALSGITYPEIPNLDAAVIQRVDIVGLTGGTITDLDSIATIDLPIDYTVFTGVQVGVSAPGKQWTLMSGTEAENPAGGIVRPDDYNETTNAKYWQVTL